MRQVVQSYLGDHASRRDATGTLTRDTRHKLDILRRTLSLERADDPLGRKSKVKTEAPAPYTTQQATDAYLGLSNFAYSSRFGKTEDIRQLNTQRAATVKQEILSQARPYLRQQFGGMSPSDPAYVNLKKNFTENGTRSDPLQRSKNGYSSRNLIHQVTRGSKDQVGSGPRRLAAIPKVAASTPSPATASSSQWLLDPKLTHGDMFLHYNDSRESAGLQGFSKFNAFMNHVVGGTVLTSPDVSAVRRSDDYYNRFVADNIPLNGMFTRNSAYQPATTPTPKPNQPNLPIAAPTMTTAGSTPATAILNSATPSITPDELRASLSSRPEDLKLHNYLNHYNRNKNYTQPKMTAGGLLSALHARGAQAQSINESAHPHHVALEKFFHDLNVPIQGIFTHPTGRAGAILKSRTQAKLQDPTQDSPFLATIRSELATITNPHELALSEKDYLSGKANQARYSTLSPANAAIKLAERQTVLDSLKLNPQDAAIERYQAKILFDQRYAELKAGNQTSALTHSSPSQHAQMSGASSQTATAVATAAPTTTTPTNSQSFSTHAKVAAILHKAENHPNIAGKNFGTLGESIEAQLRVLSKPERKEFISHYQKRAEQDPQFGQQMISDFLSRNPAGYGSPQDIQNRLSGRSSYVFRTMTPLNKVLAFHATSPATNFNRQTILHSNHPDFDSNDKLGYGYSATAPTTAAGGGRGGRPRPPRTGSGGGSGGGAGNGGNPPTPPPGGGNPPNNPPNNNNNNKNSRKSVTDQILEQILNELKKSDKSKRSTRSKASSEEASKRAVSPNAASDDTTKRYPSSRTLLGEVEDIRSLKKPLLNRSQTSADRRKLIAMNRVTQEKELQKATEKRQKQAEDDLNKEIADLRSFSRPMNTSRTEAVLRRQEVNRQAKKAQQQAETENAAREIRDLSKPMSSQYTLNKTRRQQLQHASELRKQQREAHAQETARVYNEYVGSAQAQGKNVNAKIVGKNQSLRDLYWKQAESQVIGKVNQVRKPTTYTYQDSTTGSRGKVKASNEYEARSILASRGVSGSSLQFQRGGIAGMLERLGKQPMGRFKYDTGRGNLYGYTDAAGMQGRAFAQNKGELAYLLQSMGVSPTSTSVLVKSKGSLKAKNLSEARTQLLAQGLDASSLQIQGSRPRTPSVNPIAQYRQQAQDSFLKQGFPLDEQALSAEATRLFIQSRRAGTHNPQKPPLLRRATGFVRRGLTKFGKGFKEGLSNPYSAFAVASAAEPIANYTVGTADAPKASRDTVIYGQGLAGAASSAAIGAQVGSLLGPKGAIGGALIGAVTGLTTAMMTATHRFEEIDFEKSFAKFDKGLTSLLEGRTELNTGSIGTVNQGIDLSNAEADRRLKAENYANLDSLYGGVRRFFEQSELTQALPFSTRDQDIAARSQQRLLKRREILSPQIPQLQLFGDKIAESLKIKPADFEVTNTTTAAERKSQQESRLAQFDAAGGAKLAATIAEISNVPIDQVRRNFDALIVSSARLKKQELNQRKSQKAVDTDIVKFTRLAHAVDAVSISMMSLQRSSDLTAALFEGQTVSGKVGGFSEQVSHLGGVNPSGFADSLEFIRKSLGEPGEAMTKSLSELDVVKRALPDLLSQTARNHTNESISQGLSDQIHDLQGVSDELKQRFESAISSRDNNQLFEEATKNPQGFAKNLFDEVAAEITRAAQDTTKKLEDAVNHYAESLARAGQMQQNLNESRDRIPEARLGFQRSLAELTSARTGRAANQFLSLNDLDAPYMLKQQRLAKEAGPGNAFNPARIGEALQATFKQIQEQEGIINAAKSESPERAAAQKALANLSSEASNLQKALDHLADPTARLAGTMEKLNELEKERAGQISLTEKLLTGDPASLRQYRRGSQYAEVAANQGNFSGMNRRQITAALEFLRTVGDVKFTQGPAAGFKGNEAADRLLQNSGELLNPDFAQNRIAREGLLARGVQVNKTANEAAGVKVKSQESIYDKFVSKIHDENELFLKKYAELLTQVTEQTAAAAGATQKTTYQDQLRRSTTAQTLTNDLGSLSSARKIIAEESSLKQIAKSDDQDKVLIAKPMDPLIKKIDQGQNPLGLTLPAYNKQAGFSREYQNQVKTAIERQKPEIMSQTGFNDEDINTFRDKVVASLNEQYDAAERDKKTFGTPQQ
jgi:hypothetical protein